MITSKEIVEPTDFKKFNIHADISTQSLITIYQNTSTKQTSRATPKDSQDPLYDKPRSIDDLITKRKHHKFIQQTTDFIIKNNKDSELYNYENNANLFNLDIPVDIDECSSNI